MQREYGLDLADAEVLERISWRKLTVLIAGLTADSTLSLVLRQRRSSGDVVADQVIDTEAEANLFWKRRAGAGIAGGKH